MSNKILIVDEDSKIRKVARVYLEKEGYDVLSAENGVRALKEVCESEISLILIDVKIFTMNWIEACLKIRKNNVIPIIFMFKEIENINAVQVLPSVMGDYIKKPFNSEELIEIVKLRIKRYKISPSYQKLDKINIKIGSLTINRDTRQVFIANNTVRLTQKEFDILELLASNKGIVFSIEKIYEKIWGDVFFESDNTVMVHIRKIREKIEEEPENPRYIRTVWGVGYRI
ncbi:response regulator transcription factor [Clostridium beijerinckii]|jgi:Response regulators consisting of a CheY-like receiver domain and a winged-helix DNA-binding domain|uniref:Stage 0 sporulation protein A homolog n=2 Tax=Clostridium beijerinckii TaxID=1520 RepID=A0AAE2RVJ5_CLOBE|nr:response regulator transcription factor [Clostridium beijerinckii]ABR34415.1 two component transcriptional regulator, winged helix family [Clostridium beijerinckii NCIMB 8052]AIU03743.1 two component transcriptional regulator [Clostridium beijerinckii ATCC 35702]MBF7810966.1 response regulator transcription factor [Clostridium beijerinckii]NRT24265.1 DNA-binding response OmpR family regulator [Clostridium beijerinckii]NRT68146.1 DNA-binding response OmpR family regulator [Clostridium beijer